MGLGLVAGNVSISVGTIDPSTGLGTVNITGTPSTGPNLAKELAIALMPANIAANGAIESATFYNEFAAIIVAHIQANALVTVTAVQTGSETAPGTVS